MKSYAWQFSRLWSFPKYFFLILLEFQNEDLKDIGRRVSCSFAGQFPILFGLCWSVFDFYFCDALFSPCTVCYRDQLTHWLPNEIARDIPLNSQVIFDFSEPARALKINHMCSNHRHKITFQDIVYLKFNKWTAKILKNTDRKNSTWCV